MTCTEAIARIYAHEPGILSDAEVAERLRTLYPDRTWKDHAVRHHLAYYSVNHPSGHSRSRGPRRAFLYWMGGGRYRRWDPGKDGAAANAITAGDALERLNRGESVGLTGPVDGAVERRDRLQRAVLRDLGQLEPGLVLYEGEGLSGLHLETGDAGHIDILAVDAQGQLVAITLRTGMAGEKVVERLKCQMDWVREHWAGDRAVRGLIVSEGFPADVRIAISRDPSLALVRYEVRYAFSTL